MGMSGPWAFPPAELSRPSAERQAPFAYAVLLMHPIPTLAFTLWAVDGLLQCDEEYVLESWRSRREV